MAELMFVSHSNKDRLGRRVVATDYKSVNIYFSVADMDDKTINTLCGLSNRTLTILKTGCPRSRRKVKTIFIKKLKDDIYQSDITVIYNCDQEAMLEYVKKRYKDIEIYSQNAHARHIDIESKSTKWVRHYLWFKEIDLSIQYIKWILQCVGLINHEVFHCARSVFDELGMEINEQTNEAFAYYQEYIFKQVCKIVSQKK